MNPRGKIQGGIVVALFFALSATGARAQAESAPASSGKSFFIEARLPMVSGVTVNTVGLGSAGVPKLTSGIGIINKLDIGLGFDLGRLSITGEAGGQETTTSNTMLLFVPVARYSVLGSKDGKVDLYLQLGLPVGFLSYKDEKPNNTDSDTGFTIGYLASIGGRVFIHRNFTLGAEVGLTGLFLTSLVVDSVDISAGITSVYGALVAGVRFDI